MMGMIDIQVERDTAQSMQRLVQLDSIKSRMVESQNALQVHTHTHTHTIILFAVPIW